MSQSQRRRLATLFSHVNFKTERRRHRLRQELLEPRVVLAAAPIISEFVASNESSLLDGARQASDWIEIYNKGDEPAAMAGWHLTDDPTDLGKWTFPEVSVGPGEYLVVFATGNDAPDRTGNLHTNFKLSSGGEYLALVQPDAVTVASEFAPEYSEQYTDVSYGVPMADTEIKLVQGSSAAQIWVPTSAELSTQWTQPTYVPDARWLTQLPGGRPVTAALGYETNSGFGADIQTNVESLLKGVNASLYVRIPFQVDSPDDIKDLKLRLKFDDGYILYLNGSPIDLQNASFFATYNSTAQSERANSEAAVFDEVDLVDYRDKLVPGQNVLSFHLVNLSADDNDLLLVPELITSSLRVDDSQSGYFSTPTPGALNPSVFTLGPSVRPAKHTPLQPEATDSLTVTARVTASLNPIGSVSLVYRVMYGDEVSVAMTDNGQGADATAGDGVYSAVIPAGVAQPGQLLRYYVSAADSAGTATRMPPALDQTGTDRSPEYYGTVIKDPTVVSGLPIFQWFTESVSRARGRTGARASVYYGGEFYDNVFVRQRGGATNGASQKFNFSDAQPFFVNDELGRVKEINLNAQGQDPSYVRQSLAFETFAWAGNPTSASFLMQMRVNGGNDRVGVFIEQADEDYIGRQGMDNTGALYKFVQRGNLDPVFSDITTGIEKKTRLDERLEDVKVVVDGLTRPTAAERALSVFDNFNVAELLNYLAIRSIVQDADDVRKNFYLYRDTNGTGQWSIFPWDKDWTFGVEGDGGPSLSNPFFGDQAHRKPNADQWNRLYEAVFNDPVLKEMFLRRLRTVMDLVLQSPDTPAAEGRFEQRIDEMLAQADGALPAAAVNQANTSVKNYLRTRRQQLYLDHSIDQLVTTPLIDIIPEFVDNVRYFVPTDDSLAGQWQGVADPPNIAQWSTGQTGIGFGTAYTDLIRSPVDPRQSCATCTSIYVRIPFQVADASVVKNLTLRMKYDDGFIAYLNGVEVARGNVNGDPGFDARASGRANTLAVEFRNIDISRFADLLKTGANVLAIHSLNSSTSNTSTNDQFISPALVDGLISDGAAAGIPHEQAGNPPISFGSFDFNPASHNQDEEFIELRNPLDTAVDISGWKITGGIEHTFLAGTVIPSRGSIYVSPNVPAFMQRTTGPRGGQGLFVQGNYLGHLSNFGESVTLSAADGTEMSSLTLPYAPTDAQRFLRISEVNYHPATPGELTEFVELTNISSGADARTLDLSGVKLSGGPSTPFMIPAGTTLAAGQYLVIARDPAAFVAAYPNVAANQVVGPFVGSLNNAGETLRVDDAEGSTILEVDYSDDARWSQRADGAGASLELVDTRTPVSQLSKPQMWRGSVELGGSPGRAGAARAGVVINEVLSKPDGVVSKVDQIEFYNPTGSAISLAGWYLSDSSDNFKAYAFAASATIAAGGYLVVNESQFNAGTNAFGLSGDVGDTLYLVETDSTGRVTRFVDDAEFGASASGEAWGRVADGSGRMTPQVTNTFGSANSGTRVGPLVVSELNYHPGAPSAAALAIDKTLTADDLEFIELHNPTRAAVDLSEWRIRGTVDFNFRQGTLLAAESQIVVVAFNPAGEGNGTKTAAFRAHYGISDNVLIVGGYQGKLGDADGRIELQRPGTPPANDPTLQPMLWEDEVAYDDLTPWPASVDGGGDSLTRLSLTAEGNYGFNWEGAAPTPGSLITVNGDLNGDGQLDASDLDSFCVALQGADLTVDFDRDGAVTLNDLRVLLQSAFHTTIGDANLDGVFNSSDFVQVFQAGEYEDGTPSNSGWADGDWNCDGDFTTQDLVAAFQAGGFVAAAVAPKALVQAPAARNTLAVMASHPDVWASEPSSSNGMNVFDATKAIAVERFAPATEISAAHVDSLFVLAEDSEFVLPETNVPGENLLPDPLELSHGNVR